MASRQYFQLFGQPHPSSPSLLRPRFRYGCPAQLTTLSFVKVGAGVAAIVFFLYYFSATPDVFTPIRSHRNPITHIQPNPLQIYGADDCIANINLTALIDESSAIRQSCENFSPPLNSFGSKGPRLATLSVHFSKTKNTDTFYQQAIRSHILHRLVHGSSLHLLCTPVVDGMWNKQAHILSVLLQEMAKPLNERLEWLFWADRDSIILDHCRDATDYLEPSNVALQRQLGKLSPMKQTNLLIANDHNGLNAGMFIVRVDKWSIDFFSDVLAFPHYKPNVHLPFSEQTAMEILLKEDRYKDNVRYTPQHWFNAWPQEEGHTQDFAVRNDTAGLEEWAVRRGDFAVHFAGCRNKEEEITGYSEAAHQVGNVWESGRVQRDVSTEVDAFWSQSGK